MTDYFLNFILYIIGGGIAIYVVSVDSTLAGIAAAALDPDPPRTTLGGSQQSRQNLAVQVLTIADARERIWLEHFLLAVLRPRYSDTSQGAVAPA